MCALGRARIARQRCVDPVKERGFLTYFQRGRADRPRAVRRGPPPRVPRLPDAKPYGEVDAIRREVSARLGVSWPQVWLTVDLTSDPAYP